MSFQIYRNTSVGESLMETIEELAVEGKLSEELAVLVLKQFDTVRRRAQAGLGFRRSTDAAKAWAS